VKKWVGGEGERIRLQSGWGEKAGARGKSITSVFAAFVPARLRIKTKVVPLAKVRET